MPGPAIFLVPVLGQGVSSRSRYVRGCAPRLSGACSRLVVPEVSGGTVLPSGGLVVTGNACRKGCRIGCRNVRRTGRRNVRSTALGFLSGVDCRPGRHGTGPSSLVVIPDLPRCRVVRSVVAGCFARTRALGLPDRTATSGTGPQRGPCYPVCRRRSPCKPGRDCRFHFRSELTYPVLLVTCIGYRRGTVPGALRFVATVALRPPPAVLGVPQRVWLDRVPAGPVSAHSVTESLPHGCRARSGVASTVELVLEAVPGTGRVGRSRVYLVPRTGRVRRRSGASRAAALARRPGPRFPQIVVGPVRAAWTKCPCGTVDGFFSAVVGRQRIGRGPAPRGSCLRLGSSRLSSERGRSSGIAGGGLQTAAQLCLPLGRRPGETLYCAVPWYGRDGVRVGACSDLVISNLGRPAFFRHFSAGDEQSVGYAARGCMLSSVCLENDLSESVAGGSGSLSESVAGGSGCLPESVTGGSGCLSESVAGGSGSLSESVAGVNRTKSSLCMRSGRGHFAPTGNTARGFRVVLGPVVAGFVCHPEQVPGARAVTQNASGRGPEPQPGVPSRTRTTSWRVRLRARPPACCSVCFS